MYIVALVFGFLDCASSQNIHAAENMRPGSH